MPNFRAHIFVGCLLAAASLVGSQTALFHYVLGIRAALFPRHATGDIIVVAIDADSIQKIGVWPWPRTLHASLIEKLQKAGAEDIAFDVDFSAPSNRDFRRRFFKFFEGCRVGYLTSLQAAYRRNSLHQ